jgi:uncharacterized delta-60 repeat protein
VEIRIMGPTLICLWLALSRQAAPRPAPRRRPPFRRPSSRPRLEALEDRCLLSVGALDTTFNPTGSPPGTVTTDPGGTDSANAVAIQSDGKIVAAGHAGGQAVVIRYNHDGSLDTSFNGTGIVYGAGGANDDVAIQSDGKIVTGGPDAGDFSLYRYLTTGKVDNFFGSKGRVTTNFSGKGGNSSYDIAFALAIQADGKIGLAGTSHTSSWDIALARYNSNGSLDTSFGSGGKVVTSHALVAGSDETVAQDLAIDSAGRLVVDGYAHLSGTIFYEPFVARYTAAGSLDTSFGGTGVLPLTGFQTAGLNPVLGSAQPDPPNTWLALQGDGKLVVTWHTAVIRLNSDGTLDTASFGPLSGATHTGYATLPDGFVPGAVQLQCDSKMVVANAYSPANGTSFGAARLLSDGSLDASFGSGGTTYVPSFFATTHALAIQPADGNIVVAGATGDFVLARFVGDDPCGPQIGSFTASSNPAPAGSRVTPTLAANVVALSPGSRVTQVAFYQDSNGDGVLESGTDSFLGYGVQTSQGVWNLTFSTAGLTSGAYTLFAQAEDSYGVFGDPLAITETVS